MAVLQTTGPISLADVASTLGGTAPHSLSEYYRGGPYTPGTGSLRTPPAGESFDYRPTVDIHTYPATYFYTTASGATLWWNGVNVFSAYPGDGPYVKIPRGVSTIEYFRGALQTGPGIPGDMYAVYRVDSTGTAAINTSVPTSGTISLRNLYGAQKQ